MDNTGRAIERESNRQANAPRWLVLIFGGLFVVWLVLGLAIIIRFGPLVATYPRLRGVWAVVVAISGLASAYFALQLPPLRRSLFAWPAFANNGALAIAYVAWAYEAESRILSAVPTLGNVPVVLAIICLILSVLGIPGRLLISSFRRLDRRSMPPTPVTP